jgi:hypothetical protein
MIAANFAIFVRFRLGIPIKISVRLYLRPISLKEKVDLNCFDFSLTNFNNALISSSSFFKYLKLPQYLVAESFI